TPPRGLPWLSATWPFAMRCVVSPRIVSCRKYSLELGGKPKTGLYNTGRHHIAAITSPCAQTLIVISVWFFICHCFKKMFPDSMCLFQGMLYFEYTANSVCCFTFSLVIK